MPKKAAKCRQCGAALADGQRMACTLRCLLELKAKRDPVSGCWNWQRSKDACGYGTIHNRLTGTSRTLKAHRVSYTEYIGEIPDGMILCHRCDNPPCINPEHLFLGTDADNCADRSQKNRTARGSKIWGKLTEESVRAIRADTRTIRLIARQYHVHHSTVSGIRRRALWKHV